MKTLRFWNFEKICFSSQKKFVYYFNSYFDQKQKMKKMAFFCSEAWVNPFGKMRFMGLAKMFAIIVKKVSFFSKKSLSILSGLILTKSK